MRLENVSNIFYILLEKMSNIYQNLTADISIFHSTRIYIYYIYIVFLTCFYILDIFIYCVLL